MKILIIVLSLDTDFYKDFYTAQNETWNKLPLENIDVFFYFGNSNDENIIDNNIFVNVQEGLMNCGYKTIKAFELVKNLDFDYIIRTNSSSYVDKKMLYEFLLTKSINHFYSGVIGEYKINENLYMPFCSGALYILSRDLFDLILENKKLWNHEYIDDVSVGVLLNKFNIKPQSLDRFDILDNGLEIPINYMHYRLKSANRYDDVENMYKIYNFKKKMKKI